MFVSNTSGAVRVDAIAEEMMQCLRLAAKPLLPARAEAAPIADAPIGANNKLKGGDIATTGIGTGGPGNP